MATLLNTVPAMGDIFFTASRNACIDGLKSLQLSSSVHGSRPLLAVKLPALSRRKEQRLLLPTNVVRCSCVTARRTCETRKASLYALLGVDHNVSLSEIKSAYRHMARRYHPDVCAAADRANCTQMFIQLQEAYEVLSDPDLRAGYDCSLLHPFCVQSLGKGFSMASMQGSRREVERAETSAAWKLQWEAQLNRLHKRHSKGPSRESWGGRMRRQHPNRN